MTLIVYGIPNCNSVKKTRDWLSAQNLAYAFHDFKKVGIDEATLRTWLQTIPLNTLINKKGTTWRGLSLEEQALADSLEGALALMQSKTSVIKRPIVVAGSAIWVGHDEAVLQLLNQSV